MEKYHQKVTKNDAKYVKAYLETHSQLKAAEKCGVGRTTIARAVQRAGIPLNGRHHNTGNKNGQQKITDAELIEESKTLTGEEIARRHNVDLTNVWKRGKRLGLNIKADGNKIKNRCHRYGITEFDKSINLAAVIKKFNGICQICGKPIDKKDITKGHIGKNYPTIDHIKPISKGGTHTWDNIQLAHMSCNSGKGDKDAESGTHTVKREEA